MATETQNYGFQKDASTDFYSVDTVNENLDKIDTEIKKANDKVDEKANQSDLEQLSNPNLLSNGNFPVWQRGTNLDRTSQHGRFYCADRWCAYRNGYNSGLKVNKEGKFLSVTVPSDSHGLRLSQSLELAQSTTLQGKQVTVSVKIKSNLPNSNISVYLYYNTASEIVPGADLPNGGIAIQKATTVGNVLTTISASGIIPNNAVGIAFELYTDDSSVTYTIEYCKLELGSVATPFVPKPYAEELAMCQRYYEVLKDTNMCFIQTPYDSIGKHVTFRTKKRVAPTVKIYDYNGLEGYYWIASAGSSAIGAVTPYIDGFRVVLPTNGASSINEKIFNYIADAEI